MSRNKSFIFKTGFGAIYGLLLQRFPIKADTRHFRNNISNFFYQTRFSLNNNRVHLIGNFVKKIVTSSNIRLLHILLNNICSYFQSFVAIARKPKPLSRKVSQCTSARVRAEEPTFLWKIKNFRCEKIWLWRHTPIISWFRTEWHGVTKQTLQGWGRGIQAMHRAFVLAKR